MATPFDDWDQLVEDALRVEVPGALPTDFSRRAERAIRERRSERSLLLERWLIAWGILAAVLTASHALLAPEAYSTLVDAGAYVLTRFRADLIATALLAVGLVQGLAQVLAGRSARAGA